MEKKKKAHSKTLEKGSPKRPYDGVNPGGSVSRNDVLATPIQGGRKENKKENLKTSCPISTRKGKKRKQGN